MSSNKFWPAPGSNDYADELTKYFEFFPLPDPRNYYEVCLGLVHLFSLDSTKLLDNDPDQEQWIQAKLMLSPAKWKIVSLADPIGVGFPALRLPYKSWGADLLVSGFPNYERADWSGLPLINNGCGGKPLDGTQHYNVVPFVQRFFDSGHFGAGRITVSKTTLNYQFISTDGEILDELVLTK